MDIRWRFIGRLAMPIFAYGIARGAFYTTSLERYMKKMLLFSFVSQIPFWGMRYLDGEKAFFTLNLNIGFTFFLALLCIALLRKAQSLSEAMRQENLIFLSNRLDLNRDRKIKVTRGFLFIGTLLSVMGADWLGCDYGSYGVLIVLMGYLIYVRGESLILMAILYLLLTSLFYGGNMSLWLLQSTGVLAYGIIYATRHLSEKRFGKFFYWFYPLHMIVMGILRWLQMNH